MFETPTFIFGIVGTIIAIVGCLVYVVRGGEKQQRQKKVDTLSDEFFEDGPEDIVEYNLFWNPFRDE